MTPRLRLLGGLAAAAAGLAVGLLGPRLLWPTPAPPTPDAQLFVGPAEIREHEVASYKVPAGGQLMVGTPDGVSAVRRDGEWYVTGKPGMYRWHGHWIDFDRRKAEVVDFPFRITPASPTPPGPTPPGPTPPGPTPPGPTPGPAPIDGDGLRALMVWDDAKPLSPGHHAAMNGQAVREYLWARCPKGPDNATPEFRIYPANTDASTAPERWKKAFARPRASLPWIVVSDGKKGFEGPLPDSADKTLDLLKQYGGP